MLTLDKDTPESRHPMNNWDFQMSKRIYTEVDIWKKKNIYIYIYIYIYFFFLNLKFTFLIIFIFYFYYFLTNYIKVNFEFKNTKNIQ